jgi:predicted regulator of Ras-like GTPase activity (Roadblock/LC7/MglB family)
VAGHIRRWPSISGCVIASSEGLNIAHDLVDSDLAESLSAFLPKMLQNVNEALAQIRALPADELHIPTDEVSFFIYRQKSIFLVMLSTERYLPEHYGKVVRGIVRELTEGKRTRVQL